MLDVRDVLPALDPSRRTTLQVWSPPSHPSLMLAPNGAGLLRHWWFLCPRCRRRCETLFIPPDAPGEDWRCRMCVCHGGLVYASQRYGRRHPLRQRLTPRKRVSRCKAADRLRREAARAGRRKAALLAKRPAAQPADRGSTGPLPPDERVIVIEVRRLGVGAESANQRVRVVSRAELEAEQPAQVARRDPLQVLLAADVEANARFLREHPKSRDVRGRAARVLARMSNRLGL
jgi:hypothetical protein